jgi:hypothetical protein
MDFSGLFDMLASNPQVVGGGIWGTIFLLGLSYMKAQAEKKKPKKRK